jgi:iron complex transport system substrate-binding protein
VKITNDVQRIADGWPANVEVLQMLGAGSKVVALPKYISSSSPTKKWIYQIDPSLLKAQQTFSGGATFNPETLLALKPDVLIESNQTTSPTVAAAATKEGIPTVEMGFETFDQLKTMVNTTADTIGTSFAKSQAAKYDAYLDSAVASVTAITSKIPASQRVSVMHVDGLGPTSIDGAPSMIDSWITAAGGRDVAQFGGTPGNGHGHSVTEEQMIKWNPDVIVVAADAGGNTDTAAQSVAAVKALPGFANLSAVKNNRVYANPDGAFQWDFYGIEEALQVQWAAKMLYPKQFASVNMVNVVKDFYSEFFNYKLTDADASNILNALPPAK